MYDSCIGSILLYTFDESTGWSHSMLSKSGPIRSHVIEGVEVLTKKPKSLPWNQLEQVIHSHQRFVVASHIRPDGDAIGSVLTMGRLLKKMGKEVVCLLEDDPKPTFSRFFVDGEIVHYRSKLVELDGCEVTIMVDAGEWFRLGDELGMVLKTHPSLKVCIDHHIPQNDFDGLRLLDEHSPSTTVLLYRFLSYLKQPLTFDLAEPIYLGIIVDTQNFHLPNTTEETHHIAAECLHCGVKPNQVHEPVFGTMRFSRLRLLTLAIQTLEIHCDGKVGVMHVDQEMFRQANAESFEDEGFVDFVRTIEGVQVGIYIREDGNGSVKVSWRAKGANNVVKSATQFGGGGHKAAAGAVVEGSLAWVKAKVIEDIEHRYKLGEIQ